MSLILCIETATTMCSVALGRDGKVVAVKELNQGYTHAENLTVFSQDVMKQAGVEFSRLDAIAVSKGPGSYTGLRIGVSAAKGLCYALEKSLISVGTLYSMFGSVKDKASFVKAELFCPMIDARRMEVNCAIYDRNGNTLKDVSAEVIAGDSFQNFIAGKKTVFFGDGANKCSPVLGESPERIFVNNIFPSASALVPLAERKFREKQFEDVAYFEPFYLKDFVAGKK